MMDMQPMYPLKRRSALNRGQWKFNDELQAPLSEEVEISEDAKEEEKENENDEEERKKAILQNLFENEVYQNESEQTGWKMVSAVSKATSWLATMARSAIQSTDYLYPMNSSTSESESETFLFRKTTLEDDKNSHGRVYKRPSDLNGKACIVFGKAYSFE